jgi:Cu/Ag efflux protein CusF
MNRRAWVLFALLAGCTKRRERSFDFGPPKNRYALRGVVLRLDPAERTALLKHEKIEGWMEAMTMEFPVPDPVEFAKLKEGQTIRATVLVNDLHYWVADIRVEP